MIVNTDKVLKAICDEFLKEVRLNPDLRARIETIIRGENTVEKAAPQRPHRRKPGPLNPMEVYRQGEDILRKMLDRLEVEQLKDIIAEHGMDRSKLAMKWKSNQRLAELIITAAKSRSQKGDAFRGQRANQDDDATLGGGHDGQRER